jgi:glycosyltransferase involved in cell wall biosynthesis
MRVAIDARELEGQPTGVGRVLAGVLDAWRTMPEAAGDEFLLCVPRVSTLNDLRPHLIGGGFRRVSRGGWTNPTFWEQFTLPQMVRESGANVLYAPAYTGPVLSPAPMVAAIYDVSFAAHPEWFGAREGMRRRVMTRITAHRAARVITSSVFSRDEITKHLGIPLERIDVVYPAFHPPPAAAPRPAGNRVLFVGSLFARRHIPELIRGFAQLSGSVPDARLDIVGDNRTVPREDFERLIRDSGVVDRVTLKSYVSDAELTALYASARAFVFLSEYEGFGLTPLEALAAGIPIAVLDTPVAREIYGEAALYLASPDPGLVRDALHRLLTDEAERARIGDAARSVLMRYSWQRCAEGVLAVLRRAAR